MLETLHELDNQAVVWDTVSCPMYNIKSHHYIFYRPILYVTLLAASPNCRQAYPERYNATRRQLIAAGNSIAQCSDHVLDLRAQAGSFTE